MEQVIVFQHHFLVGNQIMKLGIIFTALYQVVPKLLESLLRQLFHLSFLQSMQLRDIYRRVDRYRSQPLYRETRWECSVLSLNRQNRLLLLLGCNSRRDCIGSRGYMFRLWRSCYLSCSVCRWSLRHLHVLHHCGKLHQANLHEEPLIVGVSIAIFTVRSNF